MAVKHEMVCKYCGVPVEMELLKESKTYTGGECYATAVYRGRCNECDSVYNLEVRNVFEVDES